MEAPQQLKGGQRLTRIQMVFCLGLLLAIWLMQVGGLVESLALILASSMCMVMVLTPLIIRLAVKLKAVDLPGGRHIHTQPTPRWGGLALSAGVIVALLLTSGNYMPNLRALLTGSFIVLLVGLLDDIRHVKASLKLLLQFIACVFLILDGVHVTFLPATAWGVAGEWIITVVWIIGITNAVNFLDGMDGLVSGLAMGTSLIYFILALLMESNMLAYCALAIFGASFAFLGFNVKPARIFLGDGGSTFLGFFLAALSIQGGWARHEPLVSFFIPILILSVPIYDMVFITVERVLSGKVRNVREWLEYVGRDHLHHRLEALGLTRGRVVVAICFLNLAVGIGAITLFEARTYGGVALLIQVICVYVIIAMLEVLGNRDKELR